MTVLRALGLTAACVLVLSSCGNETHPAQSPAPPAEPSPAAVPCGTVQVPAGGARAFVRNGKVTCDEAKALLTEYFGALTPAEVAKPDGAGPIAVGPWTCGSDPGSPLSAFCSTEDNREISAAPA